ncbi:MAG: hypothetical protein EOP04_06320 [Proteobacteria bacterium]|nr:MAG: hypothetical protein EOP04_06320 [Pseudomonadota bacterium]
MAYASIEGDNSHRQNKAFKQRPKVSLDSEFLKTAYELADARLKQSLMTDSQSKEFKQRLKYRLEQGCSLDEAFELASMKLRLVSVAQSSPRLDENNPQKYDHKMSTFRLTKDEKPSDEIPSTESKPYLVSFSYEPTKDEVRRVKDELIRKGIMTEIPSETNSAEARSFSSPNSLAPAECEPTRHSKDLAAALDALSGVICLWLVLSMTAALPGPFYSTFPIAMAIEFTPLLVFRAKIKVERRWVPDLAGVVVFFLGLLLYLAPSAQTVWNETRNYSSSLARYAHDVSAFEEAQSLIDKAKFKSNNSETTYQAILKESGLTSWKTTTAKKSADDDSKVLKDLIDKKAHLSFPVTPNITGEFTAAAQTVGTRIILFGAMFLLMFVRRKL